MKEKVKRSCKYGCQNRNGIISYEYSAVCVHVNASEAKSHYKKRKREKWEQEGGQRAGNLTRLPYESKKACGIF